MRDVFRLATAMFSVLTLTGCAARMTVSSHDEPGLDWSTYRTFDWGPADALPSGDVRLVENPRFNDHMQGAVEKGLQAAGLVLTTTESPDLLIHYHANITKRIDVNDVDGVYSYCSQADCPEAVVQYEAGTLVLDIVDAHTNTLIFRGWAQNSVSDLLGDPDRMPNTIEQAVARMLLRLPPNSSARSR